jgi:vacuolar-type H+-ATPase subunit C/Vma6
MTALIHKLVRLSPDDCARLLREFENRYHLESLKLGLRLMLAHDQEATASESMSSYLTPDVLQSIVETRNLERLVQATGASTLYSDISSAMAEKKPLPIIEGIVDKHALSQIWKAADMPDWIDKQSAQSLVGEQIDAANLLLVARSKALGIADDELQRILVPVNYHLGEALHESLSGGSTTSALRAFLKTVYGSLVGEFLETFREGDSLHPLDVSVRRQHAANCSAVFGGFPFCVGLPLAFTYLMEYEISDVQSIVFAKDDGLAPEMIEKSLILWKTL